MMHVIKVHILFNCNIAKIRKVGRVVDYRCDMCYISEWMGNKLTLQLDHIDGDNTNNCIENLRLLCPNCHSQTPTFSGRNNKAC